MVDMASISALASSLQAATEITKAIVGLRDAAAINSKVIELQGVILSAQSSAMAAQSDQFALLQRVRDLEEQAASAKTWDTESQQYELQEVATRVFAYVPKPNSEASKTPHWLCANCYSQKRKSFFQFAMSSPIGDVYQCHSCGTKSAINARGGSQFSTNRLVRG